LIFEKSLYHILTASTVAFGVIGFALQRPIMDAYSGIVISIQKPFKQGDWIQIEDEEIARIVDMDWRTVKLVTKSEITYIVPNSKLANEKIKIFSAPWPYFQDQIQITLPYSVTTHQGKRILLGAVNQIEEVALVPRNSDVSIEECDDSGVVWRLSYWCPDPVQRSSLRFKVFQNILANLHFANISIPSPILEVRKSILPNNEPRVGGIEPLLQRMSLFAGLSDEELRYLTECSMIRLVLAGKPIIVQGELGDSLYILRDGLLSVKIKMPTGDEIEVARITPGNFFGEKSLLMGDPRTASIFSVVDSTMIEIKRESIATLLQQRPQIVEQMSSVISSREIANKRKMADSQNKQIEDEISMSQKIMSKILTFFDLK
jgi:potassium efflux system protein